MEVRWDDVNAAYERMRGKQLLEVQVKPGSTAGHILSLAVFGRAQRRAGSWCGVKYLLSWYAEFRWINESRLRGAITKYLKKCGYPLDAEYLIDDLSRI